MAQATGLDRRVVFRRRATIANTAGNERGAWTDYLTVWARFARATGREVVQAGMVVDIGQGVLSIRDSAYARGITSLDRVVIQGREYTVTSVAPPSRATGLIDMAVGSAREGAQTGAITFPASGFASVVDPNGAFVVDPAGVSIVAAAP